MVKNSDIFNYLCSLAPLELQMDFDNSGFQLGHASAVTYKVLLALDVTDAVVEEAIELGANLIISHHPLIFKPVKNICDDNADGARLLKLAENGIAVISMHTNLDIAEDGVNDVLIRLLGAEPVSTLDSAGCGRVGELAFPLDLHKFMQLCNERLNTKGLRYYDAGRKVKKLAVMGGAGAECIEDAVVKGCDTYVTADVKYHQFQIAAELNINLIDADHFYTENPIMPVLCKKLSNKFADIEFVVSKKHTALISFA